MHSYVIDIGGEGVRDIPSIAFSFADLTEVFLATIISTENDFLRIYRILAQIRETRDLELIDVPAHFQYNALHKQ